jgi:hypothetical protein
VLRFGRKLWQHGLDLLPIDGFFFDRPLVLLQSDDWGRVGVRDREGLETLRSAGIALGQRPYDFYTLETAEDLAALAELLRKHRDSTGRHPCLQMNFIVANLDFAQMSADDFRNLHVLFLSDGLPLGWERPGLIEAYRAGIENGVFQPALHGTTHFCRAAVERHLSDDTENAKMLRTFWQAKTPYIHWRMPWIGYEYWDPEKSKDDQFLARETQMRLVGEAVGAFAKLFSTLPGSACAPGYRSNDDTQRAWSQHGIHAAQSGPGNPAPPHFDDYGLLHLSRTVEFEPATDLSFSVENCLQQAEKCFRRGLPAIVSMHSINLHSTARDFRGPTLKFLDDFLSALESKYSDLVYLHDQNLCSLVKAGWFNTRDGRLQTNVVKKKIRKRAMAWKK